MAKTIVIGEPNVVDKPKKTIEFWQYLNGTLTWHPAVTANFKFVELICRNYVSGKDLMFAYNDPLDRGTGTLFVGQWNDGVME